MYVFGKYINPNSSPLTINEYTLKNSFDFGTEIVKYDHNL